MGEDDKWSFAKAVNVKWTKSKADASHSEYYDEASGKNLVVDTSAGKTNLSGMKLARDGGIAAVRTAAGRGGGNRVARAGWSFRKSRRAFARTPRRFRQAPRAFRRRGYTPLPQKGIPLRGGGGIPLGAKGVYPFKAKGCTPLKGEGCTPWNERGIPPCEESPADFQKCLGRFCGFPPPIAQCPPIC